MKNYKDIMTAIPDGCTAVEEPNQIVVLIPQQNGENLLCYVGPDEYDGQLSITDDSYTHDLLVAHNKDEKNKWSQVTKLLMANYHIGCLSMIDELVMDTNLSNLVNDLELFVNGLKYAANEMKL